MRFADGPEVEVDVHINAPPSRVWELVRDIDTPAKFSTEFTGAEWLDGASEPAVGARFVGRNQMDERKWETTSIVTECVAEKRFAWAVGTDPSFASATWRFTLEGSDGGTHLTYHVHLGPGPSGLTMVIEQMPDKEERIIQRRQEGHRANMQATVDGIKALAEA